MREARIQLETMGKTQLKTFLGATYMTLLLAITIDVLAVHFQEVDSDVKRCPTDLNMQSDTVIDCFNAWRTNKDGTDVIPPNSIESVAASRLHDTKYSVEMQMNHSVNHSTFFDNATDLTLQLLIETFTW